MLFHGEVEDEIVEMDDYNMELSKRCFARQNTRSNSAILSKLNIGEVEHALCKVRVGTPSKEARGHIGYCLVVMK